MALEGEGSERLSRQSKAGRPWSCPPVANSADVATCRGWRALIECGSEQLARHPEEHGDEGSQSFRLGQTDEIPHVVRNDGNGLRLRPYGVIDALSFGEASRREISSIGIPASGGRLDFVYPGNSTFAHFRCSARHCKFCSVVVAIPVSASSVKIPGAR
jgi:hypothetical protein